MNKQERARISGMEREARIVTVEEKLAKGLRTIKGFKQRKRKGERMRNHFYIGGVKDEIPCMGDPFSGPVQWGGGGDHLVGEKWGIWERVCEKKKGGASVCDVIQGVKAS